MKVVVVVVVVSCHSARRCFFVSVDGHEKGTSATDLDSVCPLPFWVSLIFFFIFFAAGGDPTEHHHHVEPQGDFAYRTESLDMEFQADRRELPRIA